MSCGVEDDLCAGFVGQAFDDADAWIVLLYKGTTSFIQLKHGDRCSCQAGKLEDGQPNGSCAYDEHIIVRTNGGSIDGVAANGEGFDKGELIKVERISWVQLVCREEHALAHGAIRMHAEHAERLAAVRFALLAGMAGAAVQVGLDGAAVAWLYMGDAIADCEDFDTEFMTQNAWVFDKGHFAQVATDVRTADAYGMDGDERLVWTRGRSLRQPDQLETLRLS